jgi:SAM-dependent methyltransferase
MNKKFNSEEVRFFNFISYCIKKYHRYNLRKLIKKYTKERIINSPVLDVGCGYRSNYNEVKLQPYHTLDLFEDLNPTFIADVTNMDCVKDSSYETVIMTEVLEHIFDYDSALSECYRVLKRGGRLITTTPFWVGIHEKKYQKDYWRFTPKTLNKIFKRAGFKNISIETRGRKLKPFVISVIGMK